MEQRLGEAQVNTLADAVRMAGKRAERSGPPRCFPMRMPSWAPGLVGRAALGYRKSCGRVTLPAYMSKHPLLV